MSTPKVLVPFLLWLGAVAALPYELTRSTSAASLNATYVHCGTGSTLENLDDPYCALLTPPTPKVHRVEIQADGTEKYTVSDVTVAQARADSKTAIPLESAEALMNSTGLGERETPCYTYQEYWYDTDDWGYWYREWKQIGQCFYCDDQACDYSAQYSFGVSQSWTWDLGAEFDKAVKASFGFSWGETRTVGNSFTCHFQPNTEYGCHSIWFQPQMTYHNGYANYQTRASNPSVCGFTTTNHNWVWANVNQFPNGDSGINAGNWGCGSGCQGDDHRQCWYGNTGGNNLWGYAN